MEALLPETVHPDLAFAALLSKSQRKVHKRTYEIQNYFNRIAACGGTVTQNGTYVQNTDYPSTFTSSALTCTYTVNYCKKSV